MSVLSSILLLALLVGACATLNEIPLQKTYHPEDFSGEENWSVFAFNVDVSARVAGSTAGGRFESAEVQRRVFDNTRRSLWRVFLPSSSFDTVKRLTKNYSKVIRNVSHIPYQRLSKEELLLEYSDNEKAVYLADGFFTGFLAQLETFWQAGVGWLELPDVIYFGAKREVDSKQVQGVLSKHILPREQVRKIRDQVLQRYVDTNQASEPDLYSIPSVHSGMSLAGFKDYHLPDMSTGFTFESLLKAVFVSAQHKCDNNLEDISNIFKEYYDLFEFKALVYERHLYNAVDISHPYSMVNFLSLRFNAAMAGLNSPDVSTALPAAYQVKFLHPLSITLGKLKIPSDRTIKPLESVGFVLEIAGASSKQQMHVRAPLTSLQLYLPPREDR